MADDDNRLVPAREIQITDRLTRVEERLIAEKSVRKTRDDQLFKFISRVHDDLGQQQTALSEISSECRETGEAVRGVVTAQGSQEETLSKILKDEEVRSASLNQITGSIKTMKFVIPLIITLLGAAMTLLLANIDTKIDNSNKVNSAANQQSIEKLQKETKK